MLKLAMRIMNYHQRRTKGISHVLGEIVINDFKEQFDIPLDWWSIQDYERQWREGFERLKTHDRSCLIARIKDPSKGPFVDWWLLYKEGEQVCIRNEVLFGEEYIKLIGLAPFTSTNCYDFIPAKGPRELSNGMQVSEWVVGLGGK
jgi:hypothetical protein